MHVMDGFMNLKRNWGHFMEIEVWAVTKLYVYIYIYTYIPKTTSQIMMNRSDSNRVQSFLSLHGTTVFVI